ncbi:NAD+ synthase [Flavisolibacter ginsenosidimutans]|uniref:Glutamine-dependent NAD(+) synthetase n=1 Tax=Flavisolibacter ginsenosidimutans TaxID=661481 RepID=A0A5B8ULE2_9BACT|nr:NAD+ synthase [Flavisolibacter ginsenosidimutans]QEC57383.1 NAD+ synthase [Flavisolibacter ginsenosidimutans]
MKIYLAQQNYHIGNFEANTQKIIDGINRARAAGAELVLFSELCVCGYPPRDFLEFNDFVNASYAAIEKIKEHAGDIGVLIGAPARNPLKEGKDLFNAAFLLYEREIKAEIHKTLLPTYDVFDENRYFEPAFEWKCIEFKGKKLAVTICEDIWNLGDNPLYRKTPMEVLIKEAPDVMLNLSASPYNYAQDTVRNSIVKAHTEKYGIPMLYCNTVGSQTEIVFDGGSLVYDAEGNRVKEMKYFEEDFGLFDLNELTNGPSRPSRWEGHHPHDASLTADSAPVSISSLKEPVAPHEEIISGRKEVIETSPINNREEINASLQSEERSVGGLPTGKVGMGRSIYYYSAADVGKGSDIIAYLTDDKNIDEIYRALILGIRDYFGKMGFKKATLGASGGIDSAVVQALAVEALGKENVHVLLMPSQFSSDHSVSDAEQLSKNLGNRYDIVAIKNIFDAFESDLKPIFGDLPFGIAEENMQSRTRGNLLMAVANKFGYILLNTSNKSELATGYGTLYGDMAGGLSVLGDLYKTQVYALARFINRKTEILPENILIKAPSAELRPGQKDSDSLPEYDVLDRVLYNYIELRQGPKEIIAQGYDAALVARVLKLVNTNEYKRNQFCPIIRVSSKAFGVGRRLPIVAKYLS